MQPDLRQVDFVVRDMEATLEFYRALGAEFPEDGIWRTGSGIHHVDVTMPGGLIVHFDSLALARAYNAGTREPIRGGSANVLSFHVKSDDEVDRIHAKLSGLGYASSQAPYDAFWGSRFAIVEDPDGNYVGIMGPARPERRRAPPDL